MGIVKIGCGQTVYRTVKLTVSQECTMWSKQIFFNAGEKTGKLKVTSMIFGWAWSNMGMTF